MEQQGSTPDKTVGAPASPQYSADIHATIAPPAPQVPQDAPNGDLLGRLQQKIDNGESNTGTSAATPSQPTQNTTPQATPTNQGQPPAGDSVDDELVQWAKSQGISLETENERKLAKRLRDTQKWAHERSVNNQQFNQIQQQLGDEMEDPLEKEVRELRNQTARRDFWDMHFEDRAFEKDMIQEVQDMVTNGDVEGAKYYSTPKGWEHLLGIVKSKKINPDKIRDDAAESAARAERENLARVQQAAAPAAAAVSSAPSAPADEDSLIDKMTLAEYNEYRKTHNPFSAR